MIIQTRICIDASYRDDALRMYASFATDPPGQAGFAFAALIVGTDRFHHEDYK